MARKCAYCHKPLTSTSVGNLHNKCRAEIERIQRNDKRTVIRFKK